MEQHQLSQYADFISTLDVDNMDVRRKIRSHYWKKQCDESDKITSSFKHMHSCGIYKTSRKDIHLEKDDYQKFIKILFWGYPSGFKDITIETISSFFSEYIKNNVNKKITLDQYSLIEKAFQSTGLPEGLLSKLLYFYDIKDDEDNPLCIVDRFVKYSMHYFTDFTDCGQDYMSISKKINSISKQLQCNEGKLEYFLFFYGKGIYFLRKTFLQLTEHFLQKINH